jgi:hypothetical protein
VTRDLCCPTNPSCAPCGLSIYRVIKAYGSLTFYPSWRAADYCTNCTSKLLGLGAGPNSQNEKFVRHIADWFHTHKYTMASDGSSKTLQQLGFHYVNIDANWDLLNRSKSGDLVGDREKDIGAVQEPPGPLFTHLHFYRLYGVF